ncbi:uncharacterized protein LOC109813435 [Cajanus cajan]|nr:uncharacterized protein LOC109813435 [Cajanus cajan]
MNSSSSDPSQTPSFDQSSSHSQPHNAYNYEHYNQPQFQQHPHSAGPSHLQPAPVAVSHNPVAVAVVAGALAQLVGNVDRVPMEPIGPSQFRGRGHRGGRPFRGFGRGRFSHHRGRGRGRGGDGRQFSSHSSESTIANSSDAPAADGVTSVSGQSFLHNPAQVPSSPLQAPQCKLWCEICKAECNTPEIMEQHKNGKRHRKNLLVHEEVQRRKALNGQLSGNISTSQSNLTIQPEEVQESEKKGLPEDNMGSEATSDNHNNETELQNNVAAGVSEEPQQEPKADEPAIHGHGFKRKMRGGRGGKYMRIDDGSRKPLEPPKPKQVTSFICELCNVKCDSQVVYNSHLIGKKHLSNFKRVYGHQAMNREAGIQPHPPVINTLSNANNFPVQQGTSVPTGVNEFLAQFLMNVLSNIQVPATAPLSGPAAAQIQVPILMAGSSHEPTSQNSSQTQVSDSLAHFNSSTGETKVKMSSVALQLDETACSSNNKVQISSVALQLGVTAGSSNNVNTETADGGPSKEETTISQDSSVMTPAENPVAANKQVPS